jgi:UDP-sugar transporter A1/2/3
MHLSQVVTIAEIFHSLSPASGKKSDLDQPVFMQAAAHILVTGGFIFLLGLQVAVHPWIVRTLLPADVVPSAYIFLSEVLKVILATVMYAFKVWIRASASPKPLPLSSISLVLAIGSLLLLQNFAVAGAQRKLPVVLFNLINQTKLFSAAFTIGLMSRMAPNRVQVVALVMVFAGAALMVFTPHSDDRTLSLSGILLGLVASVFSGLTSTLSEYVLKLHDTDTFLFSASLSSAVVSLCSMWFLIDYIWRGPDSDFSVIRSRGGLLSVCGITGFSSPSLAPIASAAVGGIIVGKVTKAAGSVRKGFATSLGIIFSTLIEEASFSWRIFVAVPLAFAGVTLYSLEFSKIKKS